MNILAPLHPAGWPFVAIFAVVTLIMSVFSLFLGGIGFIATCWCIYFFRDPQRVTPTKKDLVISPADGLIVKIEEAIPPKELEWQDKPLTRISIFLNVFDVHINRAPVDGKIIKAHYFPGKFFNASLDKASEFNERNSLVVKTKKGTEILFVQIAGLVARRILCDVKEGDEVLAGQRYGIIRFGSRTDIYLPNGVSPQVCIGQRVIGGETILADLSSKQKALEGAIR
jgi:phosphatidylserine decarboxylase